jgi:1-acyl-sn-glycerol-3-phosphate acyltransferase
MIVIDRKDRRSLVRLIKESKKRLSEGRVIAMFPEGTRGKGDKILKFQNGAKFLAEKLNLKVQPVVVVNTRHIFDSQNLLAHSGDISLIYLDPINPSENENWYEDMKESMEETLKKELEKYNPTTK